MYLWNKRVEERCHTLSLVEKEAQKAFGGCLSEHFEQVLPGFMIILFGLSWIARKLRATELRVNEVTFDEKRSLHFPIV